MIERDKEKEIVSAIPYTTALHNINIFLFVLFVIVVNYIDIIHLSKQHNKMLFRFIPLWCYNYYKCYYYYSAKHTCVHSCLFQYIFIK